MPRLEERGGCRVIVCRNSGLSKAGFPEAGKGEKTVARIAGVNIPTNKRVVIALAIHLWDRAKKGQ